MVLAPDNKTVFHTQINLACYAKNQCILTFISMINILSKRLKYETSLFVSILVFMSS